MTRLLQQVIGRLLLAGIVPALPLDVHDRPREPRGWLPALLQKLGENLAQRPQCRHAVRRT